MSSELPECCRKTLLFAAFFSLLTFSAYANGYSNDSLSAAGAPDPIKGLFLRLEIVKHAQQYLGLAYRYGGKSPKTGFDCSGFTSYVMGLFSVSISPSSRAQATQGRQISLAEAKPGDIIVFRRSRSRPVSHVAMVVENSEEGLFVIHSTSRGIVIDNLNKSSYWKPKIYLARDVLSDQLAQATLPKPEAPDKAAGEDLPVPDMLSLLLEHPELVRW